MTERVNNPGKQVKTLCYGIDGILYLECTNSYVLTNYWEYRMKKTSFGILSTPMT